MRVRAVLRRVWAQASLCVCLLVLGGLAGGCERLLIDSTDAIADRVIRQRQEEALGTTSDFSIGPESGQVGRRQYTYSFVPHPLDDSVPEAFRTPAQTQPASQPAEEYPATAPAEEEVVPRRFTLAEALSYALKNARDFQSSKEQLYLSALALMTERQMWTPQLAAGVGLDYTNLGPLTDFDQAMSTVAEVSATQALPFGGEVAARVVNTFLHDLSDHVSTGETGSMILEANLPIFRGAGRVAYESRYQAERSLIYAVRNFERARRDLVVGVAGEYFSLLSSRTRIENALAAQQSAEDDAVRAAAMVKVDRLLQVEADRASIQCNNAANDVISARTGYQTDLDRFKIRIGMPTTEVIDVVEDDLDLFEPAVTESEATLEALRSRLDLLNTLDSIDDARRQVEIARNNLLPQLNLTGSVSMATDSTRDNSFSYNTDRTEFRGGLNLELPVDRRQERNDFRSALIGLRQAERAYVQACEEVRVDVRSALRNIVLARTSMEIQARSIKLNEFRAAQAAEFLDRGKLRSNRDKLDADRDLQNARNQLAAAVAAYRLSILSFLRDTGTLRVDDQGRWVR